MTDINSNAQAVGPPSAYASTARQLIAMGYSPIPIMPKDKVPAEFNSGEWKPTVEWQRFRDRQPTELELSFWNNWTGANVGIVLGTSVILNDVKLQLVAVDIDTDDFEQLRALEGSLRRSTVRKRGRKGFTAFYLAPPDFTTRRYTIGPRGSKKVLAEFLTGNATRQTVIPPSLHPAGIHYKWELEGTLENTRIETLPLLSPDDLERFEDCLRSLGWNEKEPDDLMPAREMRGVEGENVWRECNRVALSNLDAWVPQLQIPKLHKNGIGYLGVAFWRPSSTGRPTAQRRENLGISPTGIKDFGTDQGYSPLDLVIAVFGWGLDDAFRWLSSRLGTLAEPMLLAPTLPVKTHQPRPEPAFDPETGEILDDNRPVSAIEALGLNRRPAGELPALMPNERAGDIPRASTIVPGLLGELVDWIDGTSRRPNRGLALIGALGFLSVVFGRHYAGPTDTRTNNYIIGLAPTGSGKQHPMTQIQRIAIACGPEIQHLLGPENTMSLSSVVSVLAAKPSVLLIIDEIGGYFHKILSPRASSHEKQIKDVLLSLFSKANIYWSGIEYASKKAVPIHNPNLCILGMSTKEEFYSAIDSGQVENGFLNRLLIFSSSRGSKAAEPAIEEKDVPPNLIAKIKHIAQVRGLAFNASSNIAVKPCMCGWLGGGGDAYNEMVLRIENLQLKKPAVAPFFARTVEHALKLATIRAVGIDPERPLIDRESMEWAESLALLSASTMAREAADMMATTPYEVDVNRVRKTMRELGKNVAANVLWRKLYRKIDRKRFDAIIDSMMFAGVVSADVVTPLDGGHKRISYTLLEDGIDDGELAAAS